MTSEAEKVLQEGLQLPLEDRRRIVQELWNSLPEENPFECDEEFWQEMDRRQKELTEHPEIALSHEEIMESIEEAIRCASATTRKSATN